MLCDCGTVQRSTACPVPVIVYRTAIYGMLCTCDCGINVYVTGDLPTQNALSSDTARHSSVFDSLSIKSEHLVSLSVIYMHTSV